VNILGIDPGATSGWCIYNDALRCVTAAGQFETFAVPRECLAFRGLCVVERPEGYGVTRPQMVDCGYYTGRIVEILRRDTEGNVVELTRREVKKILTAATQRDVVVTDDASCWAALKLLHTENADVPMPDKKGGALYELRGHGTHGRAAAALCVAFSLRNIIDVGLGQSRHGAGMSPQVAERSGPASTPGQVPKLSTIQPARNGADATVSRVRQTDSGRS